MVEQTVVKAIAISHQFTDGDATRQVLDHVDLEIPYGELVTITGPSGSGKTTLLTLVGLVIKDDRKWASKYTWQTLLASRDTMC